MIRAWSAILFVREYGEVVRKTYRGSVLFALAVSVPIPISWALESYSGQMCPNVKLWLSYEVVAKTLSIQYTMKGYRKVRTDHYNIFCSSSIEPLTGFSITINMTWLLILSWRIRRRILQLVHSFTLPRLRRSPRRECVDLKTSLKTVRGQAPHKWRSEQKKLSTTRLVSQSAGGSPSRRQPLCSSVPFEKWLCPSPVIRDISPRYLVPFDISSYQEQRRRNWWMKIRWQANKQTILDALNRFWPNFRYRMEEGRVLWEKRKR